MSSMLSSLFPASSATIAIEVVPVEEEEDDLDTLAFVQLMRASLQQDLADLGGFGVTTIPTNERNIDVIVLLTLISTSIVASKDLLTSIFNLVSAALELLVKKDHVHEIEIIADDKTLILRDLKKKTAQELIETFTSQHPGSAMVLTSEVPVKIKAHVSKKRSKKH